MPGWQYKVMPAPTKGQKSKGVKTAEDRFAHALETVMNDMAAEGWEFQRVETLPSLERAGLTGQTTEWRNLLVFRKPTSDPLDEFEPELLPPPENPPTLPPTEISKMTKTPSDTAASAEMPDDAADSASEDTTQTSEPQDEPAKKDGPSKD